MKDCLVGRGVGNDNQCSICKGDAEAILHALRDCPQVQLIWRQLGLQDWLSLNGKLSKSVIDGHPPWKLLFSFAVWHIWKSRYNSVFNGKPQNPRLAAEITNQTMEFMYCYSSSKIPSGSATKLVQWQKPPRGWTKLNTNGSSLGNPGVAGCGGVVWDDSGNLVAGFSRRIVITSSFF